jgi:hypothetical protein
VADVFDLAVELQKIYDSEISLTIGWFWDGGINVRLGDQVGGFKAEENVAGVAEIIPWLQEAIAHFYPMSTYANSLSPEIRERAERRLFLPPLIGASAICPNCGAPNAMPGGGELIAFICRRCGSPVQVQPPKVQ